jgi:hypothetical protein
MHSLGSRPRRRLEGWPNWSRWRRRRLYSGHGEPKKSQVDHYLRPRSVRLFQSPMGLVAPYKRSGSDIRELSWTRREPTQKVRGFSYYVGFDGRLGRSLASGRTPTVRKSAFELSTPVEEWARTYRAKAGNGEHAIGYDFSRSFYAI